MSEVRTGTIETRLPGRLFNASALTATTLTAEEDEGAGAKA